MASGKLLHLWRSQKVVQACAEENMAWADGGAGWQESKGTAHGTQQPPDTSGFWNLRAMLLKPGASPESLGVIDRVLCHLGVLHKHSFPGIHSDLKYVHEMWCLFMNLSKAEQGKGGWSSGQGTGSMCALAEGIWDYLDVCCVTLCLS